MQRVRGDVEPPWGLWEADALELSWRYAYRPEFLPLLCEYLGLQAGVRHVLDVGCGAGGLTRLVAEQCADACVTGLERDAELLRRARELAEESGLADRLSLVRGDAYRLPFPDGAFDVVTSHLLLCVLNDTGRAVREQMRVVRPGGVLSAVICFCRTDGLPRYHGRSGLPGDHRIDRLAHELERAWRRAVRPRVLGLQPAIVSQDVVWHFRDAGLADVRVDGHLALVSPGDERIPLEAAAALARTRHERDLVEAQRLRREHGDELAEAGFDDAAFEELLDMKRARLAYVAEDPQRVRRIMEVFTEPYLIVRGHVPGRSPTLRPRGPRPS